MQSFLSQKFRPCNRYRRFFPYSLQNISDSRSAALKLRSLQIFYLPVFYCHENNHCLLDSHIVSKYSDNWLTEFSFSGSSQTTNTSLS